MLPTFDPADGAAHHLLVMPDDVLPDEVEVLAGSRFAAVRREAGLPPDVRVRKGAAPAALRLSRHTVLVGPFRLEREHQGALGLPPAAAQVLVVHTPVERGAPSQGGGDRDGLARAFPEGLPVREEERVVTWLVAVARRLGGAVRIAGRRPAVLVPDPTAAVDLTVWSDIWLELDAGLAVMRQAGPRAWLEQGKPWAGPPPGAGRIPARGAADLDPQVRAALHQLAERRDLQVLAEREVRTAYTVLADLDHDGMLALTVEGAQVPSVLAGLPWTADGAIAYRATWEPADLVELGLERPSVEHRVARGRAAPLVGAITRAVHRAVGGEGTDMMDFIVDPADV